MNQNIVIDHNRFNLNTSGSRQRDHVHQWVAELAAHQQLHHRLQRRLRMYGYNYKGLTIANNELRTSGRYDRRLRRGDLLVQNNYTTGRQGYGHGFQAAPATISTTTTSTSIRIFRRCTTRT